MDTNFSSSTLAQLACYMASSWCPLYPWPISARARGKGKGRERNLLMSLPSLRALCFCASRLHCNISRNSAFCKTKNCTHWQVLLNSTLSRILLLHLILLLLWLLLQLPHCHPSPLELWVACWACGGNRVFTWVQNCATNMEGNVLLTWEESVYHIPPDQLRRTSQQDKVFVTITARAPPSRGRARSFHPAWSVPSKNANPLSKFWELFKENTGSEGQKDEHYFD